MFYRNDGELWTYGQQASLNSDSDITRCKLEWNQNQGTFSIYVNDAAIAQDFSISDSFKILSFEDVGKINQCDRKSISGESCKDGILVDTTKTPKVTEVRDWSKAHRPSKAYEQ